MVIFKCYFSREHIALSHKKWCEHRISEKGTEISNFMCKRQIDIKFIIDTWLKPHGGEERLRDLTPASNLIWYLPTTPSHLHRNREAMTLPWYTTIVFANGCIYNSHLSFSAPVIRSDTSVASADFWEHGPFLFA